MRVLVPTPAARRDSQSAMQHVADGGLRTAATHASYDEALATVNDTRFGLTSGIITQSLARATHFRRNARTGVVTINLPTAGTDYHVPFGGRGESSYGSREQGTYAAEFYTTVKTSYTYAGSPS